ncbi:MAG: hypothetical protein AABY22_16935, partial [Nanoarchaeota archaeon]
MTVKKLKKIIEKLPDDMLVCLRNEDYQNVIVPIEKKTINRAIEIDHGQFEDLEQKGYISGQDLKECKKVL